MITAALCIFLQQQEHRRQAGSAGGRRRVAGDPPAVEFHDDRIPHDSLVTSQVGCAQDSAGLDDVCGDPAAQAAGIEAVRSLAGDDLQAVGELRKTDPRAGCLDFASGGQ
ncbi:hypothetical protein MnTg04_01551 [bacterium MnTg04]|nr:hypothetical protein MnTg04_01551 [bacterium MnTg04]